jgi:hypothetical protein
VTKANRLNRAAVCILLVFVGNLLAVPVTAASGCLSACCMGDGAPAGGSAGRWMKASQGCCCGQAAETPCRLSENAQAGSTVFTLSWSRHTKTAGPAVTLKVVDSPLSVAATGGDLPVTPSRPPAGHLTPLYLQHQLFLI